MAAKKSIDKRKVLEAAQKHWNKRNYDKALVEYQTLLDADPKDVNVRFKVGECFLRLGKQSEASAAYIKVAQDYTKQGFDAKAVAVYKQVLNLDAKNADVQVALADLYQRLGLNSDAMNALQVAADVYNKEGKKDNAIEMLRKMASLDPTNTTSRLKVADILRHAGRREDALSEYEGVLGELERQGAIERMITVGEQILALDDSRADLLARMGQLMQDRRETEQAKEFMKRACSADPRNIEYFETLAELYAKLGKDKEKQETYKEVAKLYRERGDRDRAQEILQKHVNMELGVDPNELSASGIDLNELSGSGAAAQVDPNELSGPGFSIDPFAPTEVEIESDTGALDFEVGGEIGSTLSDDDMFGDRNDTSMKAAFSGDFSDATSAETEVVVQDPEQVLAEASVYLRYNKHEKAVASLKALLKVEPEHRGALEMIGDALLARGDTKDALQAWSRAAVLAKAANDTVVFDILKERIAGIDATVAASLAVPLRKSESPAPPASPPSGPVASDASFDFTGSGELPALDDAMDFDEGAAFEAHKAEPEAMFSSDEITFEVEGASTAAVEGAQTSADAEIEVELDDIALDVVVAPAPSATKPAQAVSSAPLLTPISVEEELSFVEEPQVSGSAVGAAGDLEGDTAGLAAQADDDLATADFYFEQEMYAEAKDLYTKVLERIPNHPQALLKLGEVQEVLRESVPRDADIDIDVDAAVEPEGREGMAAAPPASSVEPASLSDSLSGIESTAFVPEIEISVDDNFAVSLATEMEEEVETVVPPSVAEMEKGAVVEQVHRGAATTQVDLEEGPAFGEGSAPLAEVPAPASEASAPTFEEPTPNFVESTVSPSESVVSAASSETFESFTDFIEAEKPPEPSVPVAEEEEKFDLVDALSDALAEDPNASSGAAGLGDASFEEVFKAFKKGVSETVSEGDYETHYDLGIAYKEMGLYEAAIDEFKISLESVARQGASLHMLGLCSIELGRPENAIAYLGDALLLPKVDSALQAALQYDMGRAFESMDNSVGARACYEACAAIDPQFQDVSERLVNLDQPKPSDEDSQSDMEPVQVDSGFENFDDFMGDTSDDEVVEEEVQAVEEAPPAASFESFDDVIEEAQVEVQDEAVAVSADTPLVEEDGIEAIEEIVLVEDDPIAEEALRDGVVALDEAVVAEAEPAEQEAVPTVSVSSKKPSAPSEQPVATKAQDKAGKKKKKISYI